MQARSYEADDVVHVKFNYPVYIKESDNDFNTDTIFEKSNREFIKMEMTIRQMLMGKNLVNRGQVVEMTYEQAKPYVEKMYARNYRLGGNPVSDLEDPRLKHEIPLAEIVDTVH